MVRTLVDAILIETVEWGVVNLTVSRNVTSLQQAREEAYMARDHLERVVAERTAELEEANRALRETVEKREEALQRYRSLYTMLRSMCDNVPDMIWAKDLDKRYLFANRSLCENLLNAQDTKEPEGRTDLFFAERERKAHPEDPHWHDFGEICTDSDAAVVKEKRAMRFDEYGNVKGRFLFLDVHKAPFYDESGRIIGIVGCGRDVTQEKRLEQEREKAVAALRESEARFRSIFELSPEPVSLSEPESGVLVDVNRKLCEVTGMSREDLVGRSAVELGLFTDQDRARFVKALKESGEIRGMEMGFKNRDGGLLTGHMYSRIIEVSGRPLILTLFLDLTERKRLETSLRRLNKMEAVGTLAGGVAHEFNNILGVILGNAELARDDLPADSPSRSNLKEIIYACLRAREVVERLLCASRKVEVKRVPTKLHGVICEALPLLRASLPPRIIIRDEIRTDTHTVLADAGQVKEILVNLAMNAADAMGKKGGVVGICLENVRLKEERRAGPPPGEYVKLTVSDTGCGIPRENLERIFDPYFTTKNLAVARGMGLSVVRGIVEGHEGQIRVRSKPGQGATFEILFPVAQGQPAGREDPVEPRPEPPMGTERVLLVEDEELLLNLNLRRLERLGYRARGFLDPRAALDAFRKDPSAWDLVVTDMSMPGMNGDRLARKILEIRPDMKIILCSGYVEGISREVVVGMGIRGYLEKPFDLHALAEELRTVLEG
ncbi:MAG: PAS domain S-box protein [Deltaproteobacteria bacterium]|nr:PAS domain S-box protein [Deltaproteobacteria bacterium]MBW1923149.1 PAS domain S-box protein [Deltaproteobacteria bacterium]MBW1949270.1 PAS domain S-box protein [Deltaproteobacteria bacterium]MBW2008050.1 PAS domain S-box protein [Deltaproteobacteria bacterium]MBW2103012.1 PAS domain S-box protein [Deltaproteobacteria bacterium]